MDKEKLRNFVELQRSKGVSDEKILKFLEAKGITGGQESKKKAPPKKPFIDRVTGSKVSKGIQSFFPGKQVGEAIGTLGGFLATPRDQKRFFDVKGPKPSQVLADVAAGATTIAAMSTPTPATFGGKVLEGAATGAGLGTFESIAEDRSLRDIGKRALTGGAIGVAVPVALEGVSRGARMVGRLFKNLGSGISGSSTRALDLISDNPDVANKAAKELTESGNDVVLRKKAELIQDGVSKIRQQARKAYGEGLEQLSKTDVDEKVFKDNIDDFFKKRGFIKGAAESTLDDHVVTVGQELEGLKEIGKLNPTSRKGVFKQAIKNIKLQLKSQGFEDLAKTIDKVDTRRMRSPNDLAKVLDDIKFSNVDFEGARVMRRASDLVDRLTKSDLDGRSLRKTLDKIDDMKFKTPGADSNKLAFNAFADDATKALRNSIDESTDLLKDINKSFSNDMQLVEAVESVFGKTKFKNQKEVLAVSKKLETMFNQSGLTEDTIDQFLTRVGVPPIDFKTGEAVRQTLGKTPPSNTVGLSIGEIFRGVTGAVVTPKAITDIAIASGKSKQVIGKLLQELSPAGRVTLIKTLLDITD